MDDLTARYEAWREARIRLNWREDDETAHRPSPSEWERSDDEANALLAEFADAWAEITKPVRIYRLTGPALANIVSELDDRDGQLAVEIDTDGCYIRSRLSPWAAWRAPEQMEVVT
jgi:hypothetical protein